MDDQWMTQVKTTELPFCLQLFDRKSLNIKREVGAKKNRRYIWPNLN